MTIRGRVGRMHAGSGLRMNVDVVIPVRAPAPWLGEALRSVLEQDSPPNELVIVDDASPEPLGEAGVRSTGATGLRLVRLEERGGPAVARDRGLSETDSIFVALCDADDVWEPGKLGAQLGAMTANPDAAVCFGRATIVGPNGRPTGERWEELPPGVSEGETLLPLLYERNPIPASSTVIRREALEAVGGFVGPAPLASDWDLWLRLAAAGHKFLCVPEARIRYRRHPGGVSSDLAAGAEAALAIADAHADLVDPERRARVRASHLTTLARGRVRRRDYAGAREALAEAAALTPPGRRERALARALAVPGVREGLGRRDPFRG
jgi:glycosyltransferase involved in cell wall biosynthesis